jgi:hypothetical protein
LRTLEFITSNDLLDRRLDHAMHFQAEKHSEEDKAWELKLSKKYNDLAGIKTQTGWQLDEPQRAEVAWEAAYCDQNTEHAFTGVLQHFDKPLGDTNHEVLSIWNNEVWTCNKCPFFYLEVPDPGKWFLGCFPVGCLQS